MADSTCRSTAGRGSLDRLPASLKDLAEWHLSPSEPVLATVYLLEVRDPGNVRWHRAAPGRRAVAPGRALIVTGTRVLVLDDPEDRASTGTPGQCAAASCAIADIVSIELRSHLLDCALSLAVATIAEPRRITVRYNGVHEPTVLEALVAIRASWARLVGQGATAGTTGNEEDRYEAGRAIPDLDHRHRYFLRKFLAGEGGLKRLLAPPAVPVVGRYGALSFLVPEAPPLMIAQAEQQILLVRDAPRRILQPAEDGCDAWLLRPDKLVSAELRNRGKQATLVCELGPAESRHRLEIAVPASQSGGVAAFLRSKPCADRAEYSALPEAKRAVAE